MVDEAERSLHDALSVLSQTVKESRVVLGGGCSEMLMSNAVEEEARKVSGKKAIAVEAFSKALRQVSPSLSRLRSRSRAEQQADLFTSFPSLSSSLRSSRTTPDTTLRISSPSSEPPTTRVGLTRVST